VTAAASVVSCIAAGIAATTYTKRVYLVHASIIQHTVRSFACNATSKAAVICFVPATGVEPTAGFNFAAAVATTAVAYGLPTSVPPTTCH